MKGSMKLASTNGKQNKDDSNISGIEDRKWKERGWVLINQISQQQRKCETQREEWVLTQLSDTVPRYNVDSLV